MADRFKDLENEMIQKIIESDDSPIIKIQNITSVKEVFINHRTIMMKKEKQEKVKQKTK